MAPRAASHVTPSKGVKTGDDGFNFGGWHLADASPKAELSTPGKLVLHSEDFQHDPFDGEDCAAAIYSRHR